MVKLGPKGGILVEISWEKWLLKMVIFSPYVESTIINIIHYDQYDIITEQLLSGDESRDGANRPPSRRPQHSKSKTDNRDKETREKDKDKDTSKDSSKRRGDSMRCVNENAVQRV